MVQPKQLEAVESENRRLLIALVQSRTRNGGDVDTPEQLLENGSPKEIETYIGVPESSVTHYFMYCLS